jgi:hypothetical protein
VSLNEAGSDDLERYQHFPPAFARYTRAGEGCRANARRAAAGLTLRTCGLRLGKPMSGLVAQSAERPVVCGRVEGATPFGSAYLTTGLVPGNEMARFHKKPNPRRGLSGPPGLSARSVAANTLGLGPSDRRCKSCRADQFFECGVQIVECRIYALVRSGQFILPSALCILHSNAAVAEHIRHPSSKRNDAGGSPAGSAIARWCQSSTTVC